jgi:hypothetical protein
MSAIWKILLLAPLVLSTPAFVSEAEAASCQGDSCNNKDPVEQGCDDGVEVDNKTYGTYPYNGGTRTMSISLIYSKKCLANWAKADVPRNTNLYIQERRTQANGERAIYGYYTTTVNGQSFGNMSTGDTPNRACFISPTQLEAQCTDFK